MLERLSIFLTEITLHCKQYAHSILHRPKDYLGQSHVGGNANPLLRFHSATTINTTSTPLATTNLGVVFTRPASVLTEETFDHENCDGVY
jgi:hypothetical protein